MNTICHATIILIQRYFIFLIIIGRVHILVIIVKVFRNFSSRFVLSWYIHRRTTTCLPDLSISLIITLIDHRRLTLIHILARVIKRIVWDRRDVPKVLRYLCAGPHILVFLLYLLSIRVLIINIERHARVELFDAVLRSDLHVLNWIDRARTSLFNFDWAGIGTQVHRRKLFGIRY